MTTIVEPEGVALNEAVRALRIAALRHKNGALRAEAAELRNLLERLAQRRQADAEALIAHWPERPQLSALPDADTEFLKETLSRVRTALSASPDQILAAENLACDDAAGEAVTAACALASQPPLTGLLDSIVAELAGDRGPLAAFTDD